MTHVDSQSVSLKITAPSRFGRMLLTVILLAVALLTLFPAHGSATVQSADMLDRTCGDGRVVDGSLRWHACADQYLPDRATQTSPSTRATSEHDCLEIRNFDRWAYWLGHPGFLIPLHADVTHWVATPNHPGLLCP